MDFYSVFSYSIFLVLQDKRTQCTLLFNPQKEGRSSHAFSKGINVMQTKQNQAKLKKKVAGLNLESSIIYKDVQSVHTAAILIFSCSPLHPKIFRYIFIYFCSVCRKKIFSDSGSRFTSPLH